jgi:hypothetical protein
MCKTATDKRKESEEQQLHESNLSLGVKSVPQQLDRLGVGMFQAAVLQRHVPENAGLNRPKLLADAMSLICNCAGLNGGIKQVRDVMCLSATLP